MMLKIVTWKNCVKNSKSSSESLSIHFSGFEMISYLLCILHKVI